jgi:hypothetical protein
MHVRPYRKLWLWRCWSLQPSAKASKVHGQVPSMFLKPPPTSPDSVTPWQSTGGCFGLHSMKQTKLPVWCFYVAHTHSRHVTGGYASYIELLAISLMMWVVLTGVRSQCQVVSFRIFNACLTYAGTYLQLSLLKPRLFQLTSFCWDREQPDVSQHILSVILQRGIDCSNISAPFS